MYFSEYDAPNVFGERINQFMYRVYAWMLVGLMVTGFIAKYVSSTPAIYQAILTKPWALIGLFIVQLGLVFGLSLFITRISFFAAFVCFLLYAGLLGVTLSSVFLVFTASSIYLTFVVTALMFGIMALYGYFTAADLSAIGSIGMMALIGLIVGGLANLYFQSSAFEYVLSGVGVILFTVLTAYDTQRIKQLAQELMVDKTTMNKIAIIGALTLYLDFINLFLYLLKFLGKERD